MFNRIREKNIMMLEDLWSKKYEKWYSIMFKKKKKHAKKKKH